MPKRPSRSKTSAPTSEHERRCGGLVAGVDEAGRGCLAGPVYAAAVILPDHLLSSDIGIRDSKLLSAPKREALAERIQQEAVWAVASIDPAEIDEINILNAAMKAMAQAVQGLSKTPTHCLIDGNRLPADLPCPATAVIGGDRQCVSIAAASILAKPPRTLLWSARSPRCSMPGRPALWKVR
ncbi:MAG: ribonuclease HII [Pseudomonadota bacterium]